MTINHFTNFTFVIRYTRLSIISKTPFRSYDSIHTGKLYQFEPNEQQQCDALATAYQTILQVKHPYHSRLVSAVSAAAVLLFLFMQIPSGNVGRRWRGPNFESFFFRRGEWGVRFAVAYLFVCSISKEWSTGDIYSNNRDGKGLCKDELMPGKHHRWRSIPTD